MEVRGEGGGGDTYMEPPGWEVEREGWRWRGEAGSEEP